MDLPSDDDSLQHPDVLTVLTERSLVRSGPDIHGYRNAVGSSSAHASESNDDNDLHIANLNPFLNTRGSIGPGRAFVQTSSLASTTFIRVGGPEVDGLQAIMDAIQGEINRAAGTSTFGAQSLVVEQSQFWHETGRSIYLRKVGTPQQSIDLLKRACEIAPAEKELFRSNPLASIREILTTLSPANTKIDPTLRRTILQILSDMFNVNFGQHHPLAVVSHQLQLHLEQFELPSRALTYMLNQLELNLGSMHPMTFKTKSAYVRLLRRDRDYERADKAGRQLLKHVSETFGEGSEPARKAAREFENILMEQEKWLETLQVCFSIVGQSMEDVEYVNPKYRDKCAIYVMQDIAKCCHKLGNSELKEAWLKEALSASADVWGEDSYVTQHIRDKVEGRQPC
jgi:hypothetical protein